MKTEREISLDEIWLWLNEKHCILQRFWLHMQTDRIEFPCSFFSRIFHKNIFYRQLKNVISIRWHCCWSLNSFYFKNYSVFKWATSILEPRWKENKFFAYLFEILAESLDHDLNGSCTWRMKYNATAIFQIELKSGRTWKGDCTLQIG